MQKHHEAPERFRGQSMEIAKQLQEFILDGPKLDENKLLKPKFASWYVSLIGIGQVCVCACVDLVSGGRRSFAIGAHIRDRLIPPPLYT